MRVVWTRRAIQDLRALRAYIARDNPTAATDVARRILDATDRLIEFPASGRPGRKPNTRELVIGGTPYLIPYRVTEQIVEILAVIHGAQKWTDD